MSDLSIPQEHVAEAPATPLAALLAHSPAPPELAPYRGAQTPLRLDAEARETAALLAGVAAHDLGWMRRVAVRGEDRFRWLSGMVTNTVNDLAVNAGAWNFVLNAQGRIQGDLHVWREGDELFLTIAADQYDRPLAHLERFIIMDDVELVPLGDDAALGLAGPLAAELLTQLGLTVPVEPMTGASAKWKDNAIKVVQGYGALTPHFELWLNAAQIPALWQALTEAGATQVGAASIEALRIAEAIPAYGIDIAERDLPQEISPMRGLSFNKGCYLGQEIVERIRSRGGVHRHLRILELFGTLPARGTALTLEGGADAGQITSAAELPLPDGRRIFALAMLRAEAETGNQSFSYTSGTARILAAPPKLQ